MEEKELIENKNFLEAVLKELNYEYVSAVNKSIIYGDYFITKYNVNGETGYEVIEMKSNSNDPYDTTEVSINTASTFEEAVKLLLLDIEKRKIEVAIEYVKDK